MFAHIISQRHAGCVTTTSHRSKSYLSLAIGLALSATAIHAQAVTTDRFTELPATGVLVEQDNDSPEVIYDKLKNPDTPMASRKPVSKAFVAQQTKLFFECTQVTTDTARLACFDKVATQGETNTATKQSLDLVKTIKSTITGKPQIILAGDEEFDNELAANDQDFGSELAANQSNNATLDTVGVTRSESQVLIDAGVTQADIEQYTPLSLAYDLDKNSERGTWTVRPYRPTYVLPLFYTFDPNLNPTSSSPDEPSREYTSNDIRNTELKFQLSLKTKVAEDLFDTSADLWFGYTQESHWQVYNEDNSRPFRATDYQPEIFLTQPVTANLPFGGRLRMLGAGAIHHSNGQSDPISRSWNRAYLMAGAEWGKLSIVPRLWLRVNNEDESSEDNEDIEDFMGYGDIKFLYDLPKQQSLSGTLRYNPSTSKGAAQIDYIFPLSNNVNGYVQLFQGYGESIIDYNHENTAVGFGIVLNDWKGF